MNGIEMASQKKLEISLFR